MLLGQNQREVREVPKIQNVKVITHSQGYVLTRLRLLLDPEREGFLKEHIEFRRCLKGLDADSTERRVTIVLNSLIMLKTRIGFANDHRGDLGQAGPRHHAP